MNHQVEVTFEGETGFTIECREDEDVVTAALRQGYILLTECREGVCATCKCLLVEGDYDELLPHSIHALSPSEEEEGWVLACRLQPRSDLVSTTTIRSTGWSASPKGAGRGRSWRSTACATPSCGSSSAPWRPRIRWSFEPGQYVRLTLPGIGVSRDYSMANRPAGERELEFLIRVLPDGAFSGYVAGQGPGGRDRRGRRAVRPLLPAAPARRLRCSWPAAPASPRS